MKRFTLVLNLTYVEDVVRNLIIASGRLKKHEIIPTGVEPYQSGTCHKELAELGHLKRHEIIHTSVKPYESGICSRLFKQSAHLKAHEKIHTGAKPYECGTCRKISWNLKMHSH